MLDRYSFSFIIALALLVLAQWTQGSFIYVDRSYNLTSCANNNLCPDIKSALSYAVDDDVVLLYPGIYSGENNTNICISYNCPFKNVSMIGQGSPHEIVITRGDSSEFHTRGLNISDGSFSLIKNITFYDLHRDPFTILLDNQPVGGGAMFISASTVILDSVIFRNNSALIGGALTFARSDVVISNAIFQDNAAMSFGGAVFASTSNCSIFQSSFIANNVTSTVGQDLTGSGGAMHFSGTEVQSLVILHSTFVNNTAQRSGGALQLEPSGLLTSKGNVSIVGCTFVRNGLVGLSSCLTTSACNSMGGAVYVSANYMLIDQCVFSDNYALVASSIDVSIPLG